MSFNGCVVQRMSAGDRLEAAMATLPPAPPRASARTIAHVARKRAEFRRMDTEGTSPNSAQAKARSCVYTGEIADGSMLKIAAAPSRAAATARPK